MKTTKFTTFLGFWQNGHFSEKWLSFQDQFWRFTPEPGLLMRVQKVSINAGSTLHGVRLYLKEGQWTRDSLLDTADGPVWHCRTCYGVRAVYPGCTWYGYGVPGVPCSVYPPSWIPDTSWRVPKPEFRKNKGEPVKSLIFREFSEKYRKVKNSLIFRDFSEKSRISWFFQRFLRKVSTGTETSQYWHWG